MAIRHYSDGRNPIHDMLLAALTIGDRVSEKELERFIRSNARNIIFFELDDKKHINYLDFDIKFDKFVDSIEIKARNIVTALWFIGEWPYEPDFIMKEKKYLTQTGFYKFDGRTKKLTFHEKRT